MADRSLKDLNYGHPGAATYDLEYREWNFARQYTKRQLKQVKSQENTQTLPPSTGFPTPQTHVNSTSVQRNVRGVVRAYPQLAPALEQLPELALVSAAIQTTTSTYDPLIGNLLSFGSITLEDRHEHPRRIAASPTGEAGNILRLSTLTKERHGWGMDRSVWVEGPSLKEAESGYWNEDAAPIQQVCFAQSEDRSTFLAIRLPTRTVLFRPVYFRDRRPAKASPYYHLPTSIIDAHPILSMGLEQTGGAPHTDVAFNPDYQLQFGIVDQNHTWSVWDIEHGRKGDVYTLSCLVQGHIDPPENVNSVGEDGWARILWIGDVNTLLVCNRRVLSIVNIKGNSFTFLPCPELCTKRSAEWILDVKRHPRFRGRFFVLTSTRLILVAVTTPSEALDANVGAAGAFILTSWRHYRDAEDFTLNCSVQVLADGNLNDFYPESVTDNYIETSVLIHSRLNQLVQICTFADHSSGSSTLISTSDLTTLNFAISGSQGTNQIHIEPMQYGDTGQETYGSMLGHLYRDQGIRFYRLLSTSPDLSVHESVVYLHKLGADISNPSSLDVEEFTRSLVRHTRRDVSKKEGVDEDDDFIVPNGLKAVEAPKPKIASQQPKKIEHQDRASLRGGIDYRMLYEALTQKETGIEGVSDPIAIEVVTNQLQQIFMDEPSSAPLPLGTLMELAGKKINVPDVDKASENLQQLFASGNGANFTEVQRIASVRILDLPEVEESTLLDLYDIILQTWIASLPPDVPTRIRQQKERLVRRVAAEILLSSFRIRQIQHEEPPTRLQQGPSQDSSISLPVLPSKPMEGDYTSSQLWQSSQPLPTPPHSSVPSSSQPASSPPPSPFEPAAPSDPLARLSKHLKVKDSPLIPTILPPSVTELLAHWQPGADPRAYDWNATERALQPEDVDTTSQEQREKARRKKERRERKQQREDELMKSKAASQPLVFPRSSPGPTFASSSQVPTQSSSQVPLPRGGFRGPGGLDILAPMSQVEPGRFGGRPDKKKKKKGRVSGF
ncbi:hypothetical protein N0V83_006518 [Neocucurbitaria cava]|uniref:RNA polymerase I-specific transcription initiation factor RRN6-like protein n=1 Tax=Neocucurbitaria cava TaxID=798079 RepID=A0A9W9CL72_9PLEO|nr:hypothetical protein N0V83_006518 [Neocucurbitaria cava]